MRRMTALCAASAIALSAIVIVSPAQAAFHLLKWDGINACQVWDMSIPGSPGPAHYKVISKPVPTFAAALAIKDKMLKKGVCKV